MTRLIVIGLMVGLAGCASAVDRALGGARAGLAPDAWYTETAGGDPRALTVLQRRAEWLGVDVAFLDPDDAQLMGATGISWLDETGRHVRVNKNLSVNGRLEVLAHELGHLYQPPLVSRTDAEVFAEAVSVLVCEKFGVDVTRQSGRYLTGHKASFGAAKAYRREIRYAVMILTEGAR